MSFSIQSKILPQVINNEVADTRQLLFYLKGGDRLKFGDIVTCVASIAVIFALIIGPLDMVLFLALGISRMNNWGYLVSMIVSLLLSALISGYIFAGKLWEARRESITKITALWAALVMLFAIIVPATWADWGPIAKEEYQAAYPGATLSTSEWLTWEMMYLDVFMFFIVVLALVLGFIGLYIGSMLRKPKTS